MATTTINHPTYMALLNAKLGAFASTTDTIDGRRNRRMAAKGLIVIDERNRSSITESGLVMMRAETDRRRALTATPATPEADKAAAVVAIMAGGW